MHVGQREPVIARACLELEILDAGEVCPIAERAGAGGAVEAEDQSPAGVGEAADPGVVAAAAADRVVACRDEYVVSGAARQQVAAKAADQPVVAAASVEMVVAAAAKDDVIAGAELDLVRAVPQRQLEILEIGIGAAVTDDDRAGDEAEDRRAGERAEIGDQGVDPAIAIERDAGLAGKRGPVEPDEIVAVIEADPQILNIPERDLVRRAARPDRAIERSAGRFDRRRGRIAWRDHTIVDQQGVAAAAAVDSIVAEKRNEKLVAAGADESVVAVAAPDGAQAGPCSLTGSGIRLGRRHFENLPPMYGLLGRSRFHAQA
nr:hypothetical protein [Sphingosinicella terrae]